MRYWWVNQNQTYKQEVPGGFLWSPKTKSNGSRNQFYENMQHTQPGDIVFSFCDTHIKAVGIVISKAESAPKPDFGNAGSNWSDDGWYVPVEFRELSNPIRPKNHIDTLKPFLPIKYSPLQNTGDGIQSVYLAEVPAPMAQALINLIGNEYQHLIGNLVDEVDTEEPANDACGQAITGRTDIGETTKLQLIKSRRGQGIFKANVRLNETGCRVTKINDLKHLRASHIKPWADSNDEEKLNGCNGLLLAPHIDHLFDGGMISFTDNGDMLVSSHLGQNILDAWSIDPNINAGKFSPEQQIFLKYHREVRFKK